MPLFEIAILETPTEKQRKDGATEKLVVGITPVVAKDEQSAALRLVLEQPEALKDVNKERMKVLVRPFA